MEATHLRGVDGNLARLALGAKMQPTSCAKSGVIMVERSVWIPAEPQAVWPAIADPARRGGRLGSGIEIDRHSGGEVRLRDPEPVGQVR